MCKRRAAPGSDTPVGQFDQLSRLASNDGENFVRLRRAYIAELIADSGPACRQLTALQQEIEQQRALVLAPQQALDAVMQLLEERVAELQQLTENLSQLRSAPQSR